jgi:type IV pilus assembly protein PilC
MSARQTPSSRLRGLAGALSCLVSRGIDFHEALERFPADFPPAHRALARACSHAGLDETGALFVRLALRVRADGRLGRKLAAAMAYPALLLVMSLAASVILEVKALPPMVELFQSMGAPLPPVTRAFYDVSRVFVDHALLSSFVAFILIAIAVTGLPSLLRRAAGSAFALRLWALGPVLQARALVRSLSLFSLLKRSGLRNSEIFEMSAQASGNTAVAAFFRDAYARVASGEGLEEAFLAERHRLGHAGIRLAGKMELGMQTGELSPLLDELSAEFEETADFQASLLPRALEIPMLLLCSLLVGSIMLAMFLPYPSLLGDIASQIRPSS